MYLIEDLWGKVPGIAIFNHWLHNTSGVPEVTNLVRDT
jgi:hypothetical protein